jgi:serine protease Do
MNDQNSPSVHGPGGVPPDAPRSDSAAQPKNEKAYTYTYDDAPKPKKRKKNRVPLILFGMCLAIAVLVGIGLTILYMMGLFKLPWQKYVNTGIDDEIPSFTISDTYNETLTGLSTPEIAQKVGPSVVCVNMYIAQSLSVASSGSGIILNTDGFIVTNAHVIEGASTISVILEDEREFKAQLVGSDSRTDLAVIKIDAPDLVAAEFGNSDQLVVGERAIAIGNAAGELPDSVTQGVISGLNRNITIETSTGRSVMLSLIQTDAAINPGNSGGALVNQYGQVIGINSAKLNSSTFEGLGFAIPITRAQPIIEQLIAYGYVKNRGVLAISVIALSPVTGPANNLPEHGLYITAIESYSDITNHGVEVGDILLTADGKTMYTRNDLANVVSSHKAGDTISMEIQKQGTGEIVTIEVTLVPEPS